MNHVLVYDTFSCYLHSFIFSAELKFYQLALLLISIKELINIKKRNQMDIFWNTRFLSNRAKISHLLCCQDIMINYWIIWYLSRAHYHPNSTLFYTFSNHTSSITILTHFIIIPPFDWQAVINHPILLILIWVDLNHFNSLSIKN